MVMQTDPNVLTLPDGTRIGRVEAWADDPDIFDGWLELEDQTDQLVVNGANRNWAMAEVAKGYFSHVVHDTPEERAGLMACDRATWKARETRLRRVREAGEIYSAWLGKHYRDSRS